MQHPPKRINQALSYRELAVSLFRKDLCALGFKCNGFCYVREQGTVIAVVIISRCRFGKPRRDKGTQVYGVSATAYILPADTKVRSLADLRHYRWYRDNSYSYFASIPGTHIFAEVKDGLVVGEKASIAEARAALRRGSEVLGSVLEPRSRHTQQLHEILKGNMPGLSSTDRRKQRLLVC